MLKFKPEVRIRYFHEQMGRALALACLWSAREGIDVEINSWNDSIDKHPTGLHPDDLALDLDTEGDKPEDLRKLYLYLKRNLAAPWDVVLEPDHIHCEWDTKNR